MRPLANIPGVAGSISVAMRYGGLGIMEDELAFVNRLKERGLISDAQLDTARDYQTSTGGPLREILVKLDFVKEDILNRALAEEENIPLVDITRESIDHPAVSKIPRAVLEKHQVVPVNHEHGEDTVLLAMADPSDYDAIEEVQFLTNCRVETALASRASIRKAINQYFNLIRDEGKLISVEDLLQMLMGKTPEVISAAILMTLVRKGFFTLSEFRDEIERLR